MSWDILRNNQKRAETSIWLRLIDDGDSANVVFLGEPHGRHVVFESGKYRQATADEIDAGDASLKIAINVFDLGTKTVRVFDMTSRTFKQLAKHRDRLGEAGMGRAFSIVRDGERGSTSTAYSIVPLNVLPDETLVKMCELHDLEYLCGVDPPSYDPD